MLEKHIFMKKIFFFLIFYFYYFLLLLKLIYNLCFCLLFCLFFIAFLMYISKSGLKSYLKNYCFSMTHRIIFSYMFRGREKSFLEIFFLYFSGHLYHTLYFIIFLISFFSFPIIFKVLILSFRGRHRTKVFCSLIFFLLSF